MFWATRAGWIRPVRDMFEPIPVEEAPNNANLENQRLWGNPLGEALSLIPLDVVDVKLVRFALPREAAEKPLQDFAVATEGMLATRGTSNQGFELAQES